MTDVLMNQRALVERSPDVDVWRGMISVAAERPGPERWNRALRTGSRDRCAPVTNFSRKGFLPILGKDRTIKPWDQTASVLNPRIWFN